jgi:hypothetical protein
MLLASLQSINSFSFSHPLHVLPSNTTMRQYPIGVFIYCHTASTTFVWNEVQIDNIREIYYIVVEISYRLSQKTFFVVTLMASYTCQIIPSGQDARHCFYRHEYCL